MSVEGVDAAVYCAFSHKPLLHGRPAYLGRDYGKVSNQCDVRPAVGVRSTDLAGSYSSSPSKPRLGLQPDEVCDGTASSDRDDLCPS